MTEPKGPFDVAMMLAHLRDGCLWDTQARNEFRDKYPRSIYPDNDEKPCPICDRVAAILEAAGKMDKKRLVDGLEELWSVYIDERGFYGDMKTIVSDIDALLDVLPGKEKEK